MFRVGCHTIFPSHITVFTDLQQRHKDHFLQKSHLSQIQILLSPCWLVQTLPYQHLHWPFFVAFSWFCQSGHIQEGLWYYRRDLMEAWHLHKLLNPHQLQLPQSRCCLQLDVCSHWVGVHLFLSSSSLCASCKMQKKMLPAGSDKYNMICMVATQTQQETNLPSLAT